VEALKEGWAAELRRQRRDWAAAEEARRGAWVAQKTRDIKELTAKVRRLPCWCPEPRHKSRASGNRRQRVFCCSMDGI